MTKLFKTLLGTMTALLLVVTGIAFTPGGEPLKEQPQRSKVPSVTKINPDAEHFKAMKTSQTVDWSYLRMNHPQVITGIVRNVQAKKSPRSALDGSASPRVIEAMLKTQWVGWMPESLAKDRWKTVVPSKDPKKQVIGNYDSEQMKSANWSDILNNTKQVTKLDPKNVDFSTLATCSPEQIDYGSVPSMQTQTAYVTITSPTAGDVKATWAKGTKVFTVKKMTSYTGTYKKAGLNFMPMIDKEVSGAGPLTVKTGQDFIVAIDFQSSDKQGTFADTLHVSGNKWSIDVPVKAKLKVPPPQVWGLTFKPEMNLVNLVEGGTAIVGAKIKNLQGPKIDVVIEGISLPTGVTMEPVKVNGLVKNEERNITLKFTAAAQTSDLKCLPGTIRATVTGHNLLIDQPFQFSVRETWIQVNMGDTMIRPKVFWESWLIIRSDGSYHWHAHLWDDSLISGDTYVVGWYLNATLEGQLVGERAMGALGSKTSGGPRNAFIEHDGVNPLIQKHWPEVYEQKATFYYNAATDWSGVVDWAAAAGVAALPLIL